MTLQKECQHLYTKEAHLPKMFLIVPVPFQVDDSIPEEEEIKIALSCLKNGKSPSASNLTVEQLKMWMRISDKKPEPWRMVVQLVQEAFRSGRIPLCLSQAVCVLIPKNGKGEFRGIGLLESIWKLITAIINHRMAQDIELHDAHHGFHPGWDTRTAIMETKLHMQLAR